MAKMKSSQAKQNAQNPGTKTPQGTKPLGYDSTTPATKQSSDTKANLNNTTQIASTPASSKKKAR